MLELWQTEWCPASHRVREHLTELGVDYLTRQVPVEKDARAALRDATGADVIPALVLEDAPRVGEGRDRRLPQPTGCRTTGRRSAPLEGDQGAPPLPRE